MDNSLSRIRVKDYIPDAGVQRYVNEFIEETGTMEFSNDFTLDLSDCPMDYPATAHLIDYVVGKIKASLTMPYHLTIRTNFTLTMEKLVMWLFRGSNRLKLPADTTINFDHVKNLIREECKNIEISLTISISSKYSNDELSFK